MEINTNDEVEIRLTDAGRRCLAVLRAHENETLGLRQPLAAEETGGWSRWQLWVLMQTFGPYITHGGPLLFETTIRLSDLPAKQ